MIWSVSVPTLHVCVSFCSVAYHIQVPCSMVVATIGIGMVGMMVLVWSVNVLIRPVCVSLSSVAYHHIREVI